MEELIIFIEDKDKVGVIRFVKSYQPKKWLRKERIEYTISPELAESFTDNDVKKKICDRIKKDYPNSVICFGDYGKLLERRQNNRFWLICRLNDDDTEEYYCDNDRDGKPTYSTDLQEVRFQLSESSAKMTLSTIRRCTRDRVYVRMVFLTLENELLSPCMMITCTSKRSGVTKYFAREDGKRLRLVATSTAARKFSYEYALRMFEYLRTNNKNFLYAVLPEFKDNVNSKDIEQYMREKHISRMIVVDLQLKWLQWNSNIQKKQYG